MFKWSYNICKTSSLSDHVVTQTNMSTNVSPAYARETNLKATSKPGQQWKTNLEKHSDIYEEYKLIMKNWSLRVYKLEYFSSNYIVVMVSLINSIYRPPPQWLIRSRVYVDQILGKFSK